MKRIFKMALAAICVLMSLSARGADDFSFEYLHKGVIVENRDFDFNPPKSYYWLYNASVMMPTKILNNNLTVLRDSLANMISPNFGIVNNEIVVKQLNEGDKVTKLPLTTDYGSASEYHVSVSSLQDELIMWKCSSYYYECGAAHGMTTEGYLNYDVHGNKVITLADLFNGDPNKVLHTKMLEYIREKGIAVFAQQNPERLQPTENFKLTKHAITFVFQPYEIGPYAEGIIEIPVYWWDIPQESVSNYAKNLLHLVYY